MGMNKKINIEVAFATPKMQQIIALSVTVDCTIQEAILQSGILAVFPDIDLTRQSVGIFSKKRELHEIVHEGDRIEIYRPLTIDPKEARRAKAVKKRQ